VILAALRTFAHQVIGSDDEREDAKPARKPPTRKSGKSAST
jgi:hypothetical protein